MRAGTQSRTIFAGFGVSGSLLAAVGAAFVIAGGVLAFDSWPSGAGPAPEATLEVGLGPLAPAAQTATPFDLPAAAPAAPAPVPAGATPQAQPPSGGPGDPPGGPTPPTGPGPAPPVTPVAGPAATPPIARPNPLADAVEGTTGSVAEGVRSVGTLLPVAAPVTDLVGATVDGAGKAVGDLVRGLGGPAQ